MRGKTRSAADREELVAAFLASGRTVAEVARQYGLAEATLRQWVRQTADEVADQATQAVTRAEAAAAQAETTNRAEVATIYAAAVEAMVGAEVKAAQAVARAEADAAAAVARAEANAAAAVARARAADEAAVSAQAALAELEAVHAAATVPSDAAPVPSASPELVNVPDPTEAEAAARAGIADLISGLTPLALWVHGTGTSVAEATACALAQLRVDEAGAEVEVLAHGSHWLRREARVRARIRLDRSLVVG